MGNWTHQWLVFFITQCTWIKLLVHRSMIFFNWLKIIQLWKGLSILSSDRILLRYEEWRGVVDLFLATLKTNHVQELSEAEANCFPDRIISWLLNLISICTTTYSVHLFRAWRNDWVGEFYFYFLHKIRFNKIDISEADRPEVDYWYKIKWKGLLIYLWERQ